MTYPTQKCRSCPALVIWTQTENGNSMPVDAQPSPAGNVRLVEPADPREGPTAIVLRKFAPLEPGEQLRLSHFVTCPNAEKWRKR